MTDKTIKKLITELNQNKQDGYVITRPLTGTVEYAKVWLRKYLTMGRKSDASDGHAHTFYFIRGKNRKYGAAVEVLENDLNWYVQPEYREKNLFIVALKETVIPHILQYKPAQRLSIDRTENSARKFSLIKKTALEAGFTVTRKNNNELRMVITAVSLGKREYISGKNTGISEKRKQEMKAEISLFIRKLSLFETEVELKTGNFEYMEDIRELIDALARVSVY